ncbi:hypothetical protein KKF32_01705 [Patescibacteria group bacterium]|nr:hypothetical protein [Patescibacteria group bacterium]
MIKSLKIDFWIILGIIFCSVPVILWFRVKPLTSALLFFVIPTIYLFIRRKKPIKRIFAGSALIGIGLGFIFDVILSANNAWYELGSQLMFNYRIFGFWPVDEPIWFILWALFIIAFYEHFHEREKKGVISKRFQYLAIPTLIALVFVLCIFTVRESIFYFRYAYFFLALPSIIPIVLVIKRYPALFIKFFKTGLFFFMLFLIYELTAVKLGQWYFPGEYIGWIELVGLRFPFEELFFWMMLSNFTVLSLYEFFVDDSK